MMNIKIKNGSAVSDDNPTSAITVKIDEAKVNVFFDGTKNNIFNTRATGDQKIEGADSSYENDPTSTALMWESIMEDKLLNPVYIDGIGTTRFQKDDTDGYALGAGMTGITARAQSAFMAMEEVLNENRKAELPVILNINVFGFSRGAATARHFVHLVNDKMKTFYPKHWDKMQLRINFVGLFDTVSAFEADTSVLGYINHNFNNDVADLHLDFGENYAQKVFHIIAGDEFRTNFAVTTIASAGEIGQEIIIPGAHSDVGGSYVNGKSEVRFLEDETLREFVYAKGWYDVSDGPNAFVNEYHERKAISNEYSKVAYSLMVDKANAHLLSRTFPDPLDAADPDVRAIQAQLKAFIQDAKNVKNGANSRWDLNEKMGDAKAKAIRHKLFHVSFNHGKLGMAPNIGRSGLPERQFIPG